MKKIATLNVPDSAWEFTGTDKAPESRMLAHININGMSLHLEAIEVEIDPDGRTQVAVDSYWEDTFAEFYNAFGADGHFETVIIKGRTYALFASPYCT